LLTWRSRCVATGAFVAGVFACSSPEKLKGEGEQCLLVSDCQSALACVPQSDGTRRCSRNLGGIVSEEDAAPADGAARVVDSGAAAAE
jgi:hypothetical protein